MEKSWVMMTDRADKEHEEYRRKLFVSFLLTTHCFIMYQHSLESANESGSVFIDSVYIVMKHVVHLSKQIS